MTYLYTYKEAAWILTGSFSVIQSRWINSIERPAYYCAALAIEHFLKGYCDLRNIEFKKNHEGHDLVALLSLDKNLRVFYKLNSEDVESIKLLNERYYLHSLLGKDDLRYGDRPGTRTSPFPDQLNRILKNMELRLSSELRKVHIVKITITGSDPLTFTPYFCRRGLFVFENNVTFPQST